jgi:hypothetical protein
MQYDVAALQAAAAGHGDVAGMAERVLSALVGVQVDAAAFGSVPSAAGVVAGVGRLRDVQGRAASAEALARRGLGDRVRSAAGLGSDLITRSTAIASTVTQSISDGMRG